MQKVKEMSAGAGKDSKANYRIILTVNEDTKPALKKGKRSPKNAAPQDESATSFAVTKFDPSAQNEGDTKLLPVTIPKPKEPIFKSHPQLLSRE